MFDFVLMIIVSFSDRHTPSREFPAKYVEVGLAIFRTQNRSWKDVTRERVTLIMGKVRKNFVSFTARIQNLPFPPARLLEEDPPALESVSASVP